jgi:hypothetical protein
MTTATLVEFTEVDDVGSDIFRLMARQSMLVDCRACRDLPPGSGFSSSNGRPVPSGASVAKQNPA